VTTTFTGTWLSNTTPTVTGGALTFDVQVNPSGLASGVYTGRINISASGFVTRSIPVTLTLIPLAGTVDPAPVAALVVTPDSFVSQAVQGGAGNLLLPVSLTNSATN